MARSRHGPTSSPAARLSDRVTWLGHATVLIELGPLRVLTDPLLRSRVAHLWRHAPPAVPPAQLDAVLVSHLHRDHADGPSLRLLPPAPVLAPAGAGGVLRKLCGREVVELREGETVPLRDGASRRSRRSTTGDAARCTRRCPRSGSWWSGATCIYFAGDTDIYDGMADAGPLDVALVPIWGWGSSIGPGHLDPRGAARAVALLEPRIVVPIHWATLPAGGLLARSLGDARPRAGVRGSRGRARAGDAGRAAGARRDARALTHSVGVKSGCGGAPGCGMSRSSAIRRRRGEPASRTTTLITAANGSARIAPTTPRSEPAMSTATIVVNGVTARPPGGRRSGRRRSSRPAGRSAG